MSRRGRATGSAVSLFSFQDIITSVTAIMILLVLILTLELVSRTRQRGVAAEDRRVATDLRAAVAAIERQAADLRAELAALQSAAGLHASFSEAETRRRQRRAATLAETRNEEIRLLESQLRQAASARRRAEADLVTEQAAAPADSADQIAAMTARAEQMEKANESERRRQSGVESDLAARPVRPMLMFNVPPDVALRPRLLDVSGDGYRVLEPGAEATRRLGNRKAALRDWLGTLKPRAEYVVVILRPSGLESYDTVRETISEAGIAMGAELVGESMPVALGTGG